MSVVVPMGRVVIGSYRSSVIADLDSVTILIDDGSGQYIDGDGQAHPLVPGTLLVWPPPQGERDSAPDASPPALVPPSRKHTNGRTTVRPGQGSSATVENLGPPGLTPPSVPRRPDVPCTFKSDCDPGATCRENERGESVCMGNGGEGAACWFDNDCLSRRCAGRRCEGAPTTP
jgi:hypothetical protein